MTHKLSLLILCSLLAACQTPQNLQQLQQKNQQLETELTSARSAIQRLESSEASLQAEVQELNRIMGVLGTEKSSRMQESSQLRGLMREFVQDQIDLLKEFLVKGDLLDYVGGELVSRTGTDQPEQDKVLVDLANPMPAEGVLTSVGGFFTMPGSFRVKVMRPVEGNLFVVWESKPLNVAAAGKTRINFPVNVGVEKGDLLAFYFPHQVIAALDTGTGDTRTYDGDVALGKSLAIRSLDNGKQKRAYSLGVYGLLK